MLRIASRSTSGTGRPPDSCCRCRLYGSDDREERAVAGFLGPPPAAPRSRRSSADRGVCRRPAATPRLGGRSRAASRGRTLGMTGRRAGQGRTARRLSHRGCCRPRIGVQARRRVARRVPADPERLRQIEETRPVRLEHFARRAAKGSTVLVRASPPTSPCLTRAHTWKGPDRADCTVRRL